MRRAKKVEIEREGGDLSITVYELRPKDVWEMLDKGLDETGDVAEAARKLLPLATDAAPETLWGLYPSEMAALLAAFKEINSSFFAVAGQIGLGPAVDALKAALVRQRDTILAALGSDLSGLFAAFLTPATPASGSMDGASSS